MTTGELPVTMMVVGCVTITVVGPVTRTTWGAFPKVKLWYVEEPQVVVYAEPVTLK